VLRAAIDATALWTRALQLWRLWGPIIFGHLQLLEMAAIFCRAQREGGSVAEWLACWTQAQKARVQIAVAGVTAGMAESNGNLPLGL